MKCALITCGGSGTRLYPLSTKEKPKQFVKMFNEKTLLELTYERVNKYIEKDNIFFILPIEYRHFIKELLPFVNDENIIIEPEKRSTAPCVLYSCLYIKKIREDATLFIFPADHYIPDTDSFVKTLDRAYKHVIKNNDLVLFGIKPTEPLERYGYLKCDSKSNNISLITEFKEKPDKDTAKYYFNSKKYYWSSDISCFNLDYMLLLYQTILNDDYNRLKKAMDNNKNVAIEYHKCSALSTAYAIYEKTKGINMIKCDFLWDDVGVFESLLKYTKSDNVIKAYEMSK